MIPDRVVEAIHGPAVMFAGTRNERLYPAQTFVIGAIAHSDHEIAPQPVARVTRSRTASRPDRDLGVGQAPGIERAVDAGRDRTIQAELCRTGGHAVSDSGAAALHAGVH